MKIHPVGSGFSMQTDRWTGIMKLMVAFGDFAKAPKKKKKFVNTYNSLCSQIIRVGFTP
jgi:hypothetical protein